MVVTEITDISKRQSRVCTDQDISFVLYKGELRQYGIAEGEELPGETCETLLEDLLPRREIGRASCRERV